MISAMRIATLARGISRVLLGAGALIFLVGDRALREIGHLRFVPSELLGIGSGLLLIILGAVLQQAAIREIKRAMENESTPVPRS